MMALQKGDFIELTYTAKTKESTPIVFDTTQEDVAKKEGIYDEKTAYGPATVVLGEGHVLAGLEKELIGKEVDTPYTITLADEDAFGKKSAKKLQMVPPKVFQKEGIKPFPGLQMNFDGEIGTVKTVSGGRIIVDFNHPLASKDVEYDVKVNRVITDVKEQIEGFFKLMGFKAQDIQATKEKAIISVPAQLPEKLTIPLSEDIKRLTGVKEVEFKDTSKKEEKQTQQASSTTQQKTESVDKQ